MKFKSQLVTQVSGSVGGMTGSHNKGGLYFRARAIPVNPNTPQQQEIRSYMASLANRWSQGLLVDTQGWRDYAAETPLVDSLGDARTIPGISMYCRSNVARLQAGLPHADDSPLYNTLGDTGILTFSFDDTTQEVSVTFDNTQDWANFEDGGLAVFVSRPQNATINYFKGPYRFVGLVPGNSTTPPTSPATFPCPFPFVAGDQMFAQARAHQFDGRLSYPFRGGELVT